MSGLISDGGPAFPFEVDDRRGTATQYVGLSARDYFAAAALQGMLAGGFADTVPHDDVTGGSQAAAFAYMYADALIAEGGRGVR